MIGASDEQVDVFNEVWYTVLINAGEASKGLMSSLPIELIFFNSMSTYVSS